MDGPKVFLTAEWRALAMLNYEVNPSLLLRYVPPGTEVDSWSGKAFVSLVAFRFLNTRVFGVRFPFHCNFTEVNLRFYVRRRERSEVRRGVVFIREIVPRRAIAAVARGFYNERYLALPMSHRLNSNSANITAEYGWKSEGGWNKIHLSAKGDPALPKNDSLEQFITEHYWGYARGKNDTCIEYRVQHPQWRVWKATEAAFEGNAEEVYGKDFSAILRQQPSSAFLAEGSEVAVYGGTVIPSDFPQPSI
ncbi:MAG TPA: DUF2071 domain-containing protein [Terriglobales bacterium]|nr:DUF2071 domain-containing protein [Terriglobales bacterium]